ncbi:MAG TPA: metallophosphoesterase [Clostridiales bacterium]|jgi:predicted phosphodiesterase|nr:metallophosphoesterase [Clostridiales bacterium]
MLKFNRQGEFTLMQVTDPQDNIRPRRALIKMLNAAYDTAKPDLVVMTGDNMLGKIAKEKSLDEKYKIIEGVIEYLIKPLQERNIPFAVTFGNHDDQCGITKKQQVEIYMRYPNCVGFNDEEPDRGRSTYNIPIYSSDGKKIAYNIWMMESAGKNEAGEYFEYVSEKALAWYLKTSESLKRENDGKLVNSLMFQHVPVPEIFELLKETEKGPGAVEKNGKYYVLDKEKAEGFLGEGPCVTQKNFGQFETVRKQGDVKALVFGHDHINAFRGKVRGQELIQSPGASFCSYGNSLRGVSAFKLNEKDTEGFETYNISYFNLLGRGLKAKAQYIFSADGLIPLRFLVAACPPILPFLFRNSFKNKKTAD